MEVFDFMPYTYYTRMTVYGGKYSAESGQSIADSCSSSISLS